MALAWIRHLEREVAAWEGENQVLGAAIASLDGGGAARPPDSQRQLEDALLAAHAHVTRLRAEHDELREALELKQVEARGVAHDLAQFRETRRRAAVETATLHVCLEESLVALDVSASGRALREQLRAVRELAEGRAARAGAVAGGGGAAAEPGRLRAAGGADVAHRARFASYGLHGLAQAAGRAREDLGRLERGVERARARAWAEDRAALRTARELCAASLARLCGEAGGPSRLLEGCLPLLLGAAAQADELQLAARVAVGRLGALREARKAQRLRRLQARAAQCRQLLGLAAAQLRPSAEPAAGPLLLGGHAQALLVDAELRAEVRRLQDLSAGVQEEEAQLRRLQRYVGLCGAHTAALEMASIADERAAWLEEAELAVAARLVSARRRLRAIRRVGASGDADDLGAGSAALCEKCEGLAACAAAVSELGEEVGALLELAATPNFTLSRPAELGGEEGAR